MRDTKMESRIFASADLDEMLNHSEEGGGLSADVVQEESIDDDSKKAED